MISKNKNLFLKIYIPFVIITIIALIVLQILGSKNRVGYLTDFKLNVYKTLELNNLENINNKLDEEGLKNFILNNENITNYIYQFRIRYYDIVFRNSDIYGVYVDLNDLPDYMENAEMEENGSPYGNFISDKKTIEEEKIDNINYTLKLKYSVFFLLPLYFLILLTYFIIINIKKIDFKSVIGYIRVNYKNLYGIFTLIFIMLIIILYLLGNLNHRGSLENFELITESPAGYVYKANVVSKGFFSPNLIYEYSDKPLKLESKPDYIKNYGYALEINRMPDWYNTSIGASAWNNDDGTFTISNSTSWNCYDYIIPMSKGEKYKISIDIKNINTNQIKIYYYLDHKNNSWFKDNYIIIDTNLTDSTVFYDIIEIDSISINKNPYLNFNFDESEINIKSIKIEQINDKMFINKDKEIILTSKKIIDNNTNISLKNLSFRLNKIIYILAIIFIVSFILLLNIKRKYFNFIFISSLITIALFLFQYWLCFPGFFAGNIDMIVIMNQAVSGVYTNHHPIIASLIQTLLNSIFGYNTYYLFLINLSCWYIGLFILIIGLYIRYNKNILIFLFLLSFIYDVFFMNMTTYKDALSSNFFWLFICLIFFMQIVNLKNIYLKLIIKIISVIMLLLTLLIRNNMIVIIYPVFLYISYLIIKKYFNNFNNNIKKYLVSFTLLMFIFAIILITIVKLFPLAYVRDDYNKKISNVARDLIFVTQILSLSIPNDDDSMIKENWYFSGLGFEDTRSIYYKYYNSNPYIDSIVFTTFDHGTIDIKKITLDNNNNLKKIWFNYIKKYPFTYIKYIFNFFKCYLKVNQELGGIPNAWYMQHTEGSLDNFYSTNRKIAFDSSQEDIYSLLFNSLPRIKIYNCILLSLLIIIISITYLLKNRLNSEIDILLISLCSSLSVIVTYFIVSIFTNMSTFRYIYPVIPLSIISLISNITFIRDRGGFKKFIKELKNKRGENK